LKITGVILSLSCDFYTFGLVAQPLLMLSQKASNWLAKQKAPNARRAIGEQ
jgi:hypothetical protein